MNKKFSCAECGAVFESEWSDEEARVEAAEVFGKSIDEWNGGKEIVCDDCYQTIMSEINVTNVKKYL